MKRPHRRPDVAEDSREAVGRRIRSLRRAAGLTQEQLAGGRYSKAYMSQIERGQTRPTAETLDWLAERLGTDRDFLERGLTREDAARVGELVDTAEELAEAHRDDEALTAFQAARELAGDVAEPKLVLRMLTGEAWVRTRRGELDEALSLLAAARRAAAAPGCTVVDRADVIFRVGVCRYSRSDIPAALDLFAEALRLTDHCELPCDRLRSDIFHWRARCYRRQHDWVAAREDVDRSLELAEGRSDLRRVADAYFQSSLIAQREGRWVLARSQAERAKELFEHLGDRATVGRLLNNLAGLNHLLGHPVEAKALLREAFAIFVEMGLDVEAGYVSASLAEIQLEGGEPEHAERQARQALDLLDGRLDHLQEVGSAQVMLGRALTAQGKLVEAQDVIATAVATFEQADSIGHLAEAWVAEGDLASRHGDDEAAARMYRQAAEALRERQT